MGFDMVWHLIHFALDRRDRHWIDSVLHFCCLHRVRRHRISESVKDQVNIHCETQSEVGT